MHSTTNLSSPFPCLNGHIQALFFDLDGTLRHDAPSSHETFFNFAVELGAPDTPSNRPLALRWAHAYWANVNQTAEQDLNQHGRNTPEFWQNYARRYLLAYGCHAMQAETLALLLHTRMEEHHKPTNTLAPDTHATLNTLQASGYRLGLITNRTRPCHEELETLGIAHYFDLILTAGEVNAYKPEPAIFEHALARTGLQPQATLYIGDNYYADVIGAERAGMTPILLDPARVFPEATCPINTTQSDLPALHGHG